jgi:hypothetical protein
VLPLHYSPKVSGDRRDLPVYRHFGLGSPVGRGEDNIHYLRLYIHYAFFMQSARDPLFRAALAIANQDIEGIGEFCLRCHAPRGWLEGRSRPADGAVLNRQFIKPLKYPLYGLSAKKATKFS